jgi:hypothetical protein
MENLFGKLQEACRKANAQEIENLLQETQVQYPKEYREAKEKVSEYLIFANCPKEAKERIEKEILKPIDQMTFEGLIEIAITILSILSEENSGHNEQGNI